TTWHSSYYPPYMLGRGVNPSLSQRRNRMICQRCGSQPAPTVYRVTLNGHQQTWRLCTSCAEGHEPLSFAAARARRPIPMTLSEEALASLKAACTWAAERGCPEVGPEFVLLGILTSGSEAGQKLASSGLKAADLRE